MYRVLLNLGQGDWKTGFPSVVVQLWNLGEVAPMQLTGSLPAAESLGKLHDRWRKYYLALQSNLGVRHSAVEMLDAEPSAVETLAPKTSAAKTIEIEDDDVTHGSMDEFHSVSRLLQRQLNLWLSVETFAGIERKLRTILSAEDAVQLIVEVDQPALRRFPWHLWNFLEDYPNAEIGLSKFDFGRVKAARRRKKKVRVLAIFGSSKNINVKADKDQLEQIIDADVVMLTEPSRSVLSQKLWDERGWDILFFAGHSSTTSDGKSGYVDINPSEKIAVSQLKQSLNEAISHGLQLAIFNSCEGLGIAKELAEVQFPQTIVMREPVPDQVAQAFLLNFLKAFSQGMPLYLAVRKARSRLETMEGTFPGASWLPMICQNPAVSKVLTWERLRDPIGTDASSLWYKWRRVGQVAIACFLGVGLTIGARHLGALETVELKAFDHLMRLRPKESLDKRLLVITVTEADVQAQTSRQTSLSDEKLSQVIARLQQYEPRAIGLDIYRDIPTAAKYPSLIKAFQADDNFLSICRFGTKGSALSPEIEPSPNIPLEKRSSRVGFSDGMVDLDGVTRRQLLGMSPPEESACSSSTSLNLMLALRYLKPEGMGATVLENGQLKIGEATIPAFYSHTGGYQTADARGYQLMLNYRSLEAPEEIAEQLTLGQFLEGEYSADEWSELIRDRVVIIGSVATSFQDFHATPYSWKTPGVFIQAHQVSQLLSAVLDDRPLIASWPQALEDAWIVGWVMLGGVVLVLVKNSRLQALGLLGLGGANYGACYFLLLQGIWVPLLSPLLALAGTSLIASLLLAHKAERAKHK